MYNANLKVGILGSGVVGQVLSKAFLNEGHEVMLGSRNNTKDQMLQWKKDNPKGNIGTYADTSAFADLIIIATKGSVVEEVLNQAGLENFTGKTVIDTTNPIADAPPVNGVLKFFTDLNQSLMERIQNYIPKAHVVKAFNSVGSALMYRPDFGGAKGSMFICGNNDEAKSTVSSLLEKFGWEPEDMGKAEAARAIEPLCILWCIPGMLRNEWTHAFKLLKSK
jgi:8-hydroxy-5-deazaflavin:NADPH oxidoreductase